MPRMGLTQQAMRIVIQFEANSRTIRGEKYAQTPRMSYRLDAKTGNRPLRLAIQKIYCL